MSCFCFQWFSFFWYFDLNWPGHKPRRGCQDWRRWKGKERRWRAKERRSKECQDWRRWKAKERYEKVSLSQQKQRAGKWKKGYEARFKNKTTPPPWLNFPFFFAAGWGWGLRGHDWKLQFPSQKSWNLPWSARNEAGFFIFQLSQRLSCFFGFHLIFTAFWSKFEFQKSEFHQSLIKLWVSKVWVLSKFDFWKSEFCQSLTFKSPSFVKLWLLKVWVLSKFDAKSLSFIKVCFFIKVWQKSDF